MNSSISIISTKPGSGGKLVYLDLDSQSSCILRQWKMLMRCNVSNQTQILHLLNTRGLAHETAQDPGLVH